MMTEYKVMPLGSLRTMIRVVSIKARQHAENSEMGRNRQHRFVEHGKLAENKKIALKLTLGDHAMFISNSTSNSKFTMEGVLYK